RVSATEKTMLIASRETKSGRIHRVAGKNWTFVAAGADGPPVCEVDDDAAVAVFLHQRNANLFYSLDNPPALTRVHGDDTDPALAVLDQTVVAIRKALADGNYTREQLEALHAAESTGSNRKSVLTDLEHLL